MTLRHHPFAENQDYVFRITQGQTAGGDSVDPFGLDFSVIDVYDGYLPLLLR
jgi:hypothetical protein